MHVTHSTFLYLLLLVCTVSPILVLPICIVYALPLTCMQSMSWLPSHPSMLFICTHSVHTPWCYPIFTIGDPYIFTLLLSLLSSHWHIYLTYKDEWAWVGPGPSVSVSIPCLKQNYIKHSPLFLTKKHNIDEEGYCGQYVIKPVSLLKAFHRYLALITSTHIPLSLSMHQFTLFLF